MMTVVNNPVALITGAARRIGADIARNLHFQNYNVVIHYHHSSSEAIALTKELNSLRPDSAICIHGDLLNTALLNDLIHEAVQIWQRLDALINNASTFYLTPIGEITEVQWGDLMGSNLKAPFFLIQAAVPYLRQQKGSVINIIDIHAKKPMLDHSVYSIAKAGLAMLTKSLALELGPEIRVNGVSPGVNVWPEGQNQIDLDKQTKMIAKIPLKRVGTPQDIAEAVKFLLANDYITGQIISVDGGKSLV
jgi:pteridine reductase